MPSLASLNHHFAIPGRLSFKADIKGAPHVVEIDNAFARATIALQGAHVQHFQPHGADPVLWLGKELLERPRRGGVPICWPWFGAHPEQAGLPAHGFARLLEWRVIGTEQLVDGATRISFELHKTPAVRAQWPHMCHLRCMVTVGATLTVALITENRGEAPLIISEALHTYLSVGDVDRVRVLGLEDCPYFDKADGSSRVQQGPVEIHAEIDRVFQGTTADCVIEDPVLGRRIRVSKHGSRTTVVWNPWAEKGAALGDLGEEGYRRMLCVESANALDSTYTLEPGEIHSLVAVYAVEAL